MAELDEISEDEDSENGNGSKSGSLAVDGENHSLQTLVDGEEAREGAGNRSPNGYVLDGESSLRVNDAEDDGGKSIDDS